MNIPNILTIIRFLLIPIFAIFLYEEYYLISSILFTIAGITDVLDGYIARKYNIITNFGKFADPIADKLLQITAILLLTLQQKIPLYVILIVIVKEAFMVFGSVTLLKKENHVVSANWYGKLATVIFYIAIMLLIVFDKTSNTIRLILIWMAIISTLFAFVMYYIKTYRKIIKDSKNHLNKT